MGRQAHISLRVDLWSMQPCYIRVLSIIGPSARSNASANNSTLQSSLSYNTFSLDPYIDDILFPRMPVIDHLQALPTTRLPFSRVSSSSFLSCFALFQRQYSCSTRFHTLPNLLVQSRNTKTLAQISHLSQNRSPLYFVALLSPSTSTIIGLARLYLSDYPYHS